MSPLRLSRFPLTFMCVIHECKTIYDSLIACQQIRSNVSLIQLRYKYDTFSELSSQLECSVLIYHLTTCSSVPCSLLYIIHVLICIVTMANLFVLVARRMLSSLVML